MKRLILLFSVWLLSVLVYTPLAFTQEPWYEFLQALREKQYFDSAITYLDESARRPTLSFEVRSLVAYEKACTILAWANALHDSNEANERYAEALRLFEEFLQQYPDNPRIGDANSQRGQILMRQLEAEMFPSKARLNETTTPEFQKHCRQLIQQARRVFKVALDQHGVVYKKISETKQEGGERNSRAERLKIESTMFLEELCLAKCTLNEALTYKTGTPEFKQLLVEATEAFNTLYAAHRSQLGGLHARGWEGRCLEKQGNLQDALRIYDELLQLPGDDSGLVSLKAEVLWRKLGCLSIRGDNQTVVGQAEEWLQKNANASTTMIGLQIQLNQAAAYEALGNNPDLALEDQKRFWRKALGAILNIKKSSADFPNNAAPSMEQRLEAKLAR